MLELAVLLIFGTSVLCACVHCFCDMFRAWFLSCSLSSINALLILFRFVSFFFFFCFGFNEYPFDLCEFFFLSASFRSVRFSRVRKLPVKRLMYEFSYISLHVQMTMDLLHIFQVYWFEIGFASAQKMRCWCWREVRSRLRSIVFILFFFYFSAVHKENSQSENECA